MGPGQAPAARRGDVVRRGRVPGRVDHVLPRGQVERQVHRGDEALRRRATPPHVGVAGGQELLSRHRAEQPAERAGQQQGPGSGVDALAGHVDQRDLERLAVAERHHEIAAERGAAGGPEHRRRAPPLAQRGQLALGLDAVPQLQQHPVAAQALDAELLAGPGQDVGEDRGQRDGGHDPGPGLALHHVVDQRAGDHGEEDAQGPGPHQQAAGQDRQDHHARREPPYRDVHGRHRDGDHRDRQDERHPAVPGDELVGQLGTQDLKNPADPSRAAAAVDRRRGNHDARTVVDGGPDGLNQSHKGRRRGTKAS